jgi:hypothetical protein
MTENVPRLRYLKREGPSQAQESIMETAE